MTGRGELSIPLDEFIVLGVRANPDPRDGVAVTIAEHTVSFAYACGPEVAPFIDLLEVEAWMKRVRLKAAKRFPRVGAYLLR